MIRINKSTEVPESLTKSIEKEIEKAKSDYVKDKVITVEFSAYRNKDVKKLLIEEFNSKCAYCEMRFVSVSPGAVEHFRPKGRNKKTNKSYSEGYVGYYWLACDWDNLLLSCTDCNSARGHEVPGLEGEISIGKQDQFPLDDETHRWINHLKEDGLEKENDHVLLVNPTKEDPKPYFDFDTDGTIKVAGGLTGFQKKKSQTSILVYALHRMELVHERKEYFLEHIGKVFTNIDKLKRRNLEKGMSLQDVDQVSANQLDLAIDDLIELTRPHKVFSAMARKLLERELLARFNIDLNAVLS